jgi:hypothetical protein
MVLMANSQNSVSSDSSKMSSLTRSFFLRLFADPARLSHAHAERMLRFRQRSFSADDLSPSAIEQEIKEREDNVAKVHGPPGQ